jgi:glycerate kinase
MKLLFAADSFKGRTDWQSCFGKVMQGVGLRAKAKGIPALGISGALRMFRFVKAGMEVNGDGSR